MRYGSLLQNIFLSGVWAEQLTNEQLEEYLRKDSKKASNLIRTRYWHFPKNILNQLQKADGLDLSGITLLHYSLEGVSLKNPNFTNADLSYSNFRNSYLENPNFTEVVLGESKLQGAYIVRGNLKDIKTMINSSSGLQFSPDTTGACFFDCINMPTKCKTHLENAKDAILSPAQLADLWRGQSNLSNHCEKFFKNNIDRYLNITNMVIRDQELMKNLSSTDKNLLCSVAAIKYPDLIDPIKSSVSNKTSKPLRGIFHKVDVIDTTYNTSLEKLPDMLLKKPLLSLKDCLELKKKLDNISSLGEGSSDKKSQQYKLLSEQFLNILHQKINLNQQNLLLPDNQIALL
ncbi:MAG: hypothetical protein AAF195_04070 [Pseudomonadota bacterium]